MTLSRRAIGAALVLSALVAALAVTSQSYWIDEALSLIIAQAPDPAEAWKYMMAVSGSTLQMPLYQFYLYGWHKLLGGGEWIMRASNVPWFLIGQAAFLVLLRDRPRLALTACLLAAVSPIIWTYLDETRPYVMQYAAACWLLAGLAKATLARKEGCRFNGAESAAICGAFFVLFSSSLIGAVWSAGFGAAFLLMLSRMNVPTKNVVFWLIVLLTGALMALTAAYYFLTWTAAKKGYHLSGASLLSIPFVAFELLGFAGFGPGKAALRSEPFASLSRSLPLLLPLAIVLGPAVVASIMSMRGRPIDKRSLVAWFLAVVLPTTAIFGAFFVEGHRPLPRHFLPLLPAIILILSAGLCMLAASKSLFSRALAFALPVLWLMSALGLRLGQVHAKEDYRSAAKIATSAINEGLSVWWAADAATAFVYGTPIALQKTIRHAWGIQAPEWEQIESARPPDLIVLSRPDVYDPQGTILRYMDANSFFPSANWHGMTIYSRQNSTGQQP
jgi:hypothetical protein